ncbi:peroxisomal trans-2-enoyl-CoA reductase-like [Centruroides sculpturatus]|uniref:peroxisomal trans-2-enoyl-CoA reductase-like n=1 Tax=Centruroides sculpturatus TaxID=218467 RepID=UPI000C6C9193|nr:peroxisomal trans-2-enoyl-CoA reductase-like [Centruroides sculpturatus]
MANVASVFKSNLFNKKVAIVTGGATGIGRVISRELLSLGCKVVVASRKEERLSLMVEETRRWMDASPPPITGIKCDVRNETEVKKLIETTLKKYGKLDYLVNNGGGQFLSQASEISKNGWDAVVNTNLTGTFLMCREAYNQWMKENKGVIVNIVMNNYRGSPMMAHSAAARAGVQNLTKSLSIEWAEHGVRVNAVAPGTIYSETAAKNYPVNVFDVAKDNLPAKRCGTPEEISAVVCFLLSPAASYITGETIYVDGGERLYSPLFWKISEHHNLPPFPSNL